MKTKLKNFYVVMIFAVFMICNGNFTVDLHDSSPALSHSPVLPVASQFPATHTSDLTGIIAIWNGSLESIPEGWALCDGNNGTPDLAEKFIKGADYRELPGRTGGNLTHHHIYYELPRHNHQINDPGHTHPFTTKSFSAGSQADYSNPSAYDISYDYGLGDVSSRATFYFNVEPNGLTGNLSTLNASNLPDFMRLPFIMKISNSSVIPDGLITYWAGNSINLPTGWIPCNGSSSPDLRSRFILGTTNSSLLRTVGGSASHQHAYHDLPYHTHEIFNPGHTHTYYKPKPSDSLTTTSGTTAAYRYYISTRSTSTSPTGVSIRESGLDECTTESDSHLPPYVKLLPILKNSSVNILPSDTVVMWGREINNIPSNISLCDGSEGTPALYGKFLLSAESYLETGQAGGSDEHYHFYDQVPKHYHNVTEAAHSHPVEVQPDSTINIIPSTSGRWISQVGLVDDNVQTAYTGIQVKYAGDEYCTTDSVDHLPPYHTLSLLTVQENLTHFVLPPENGSTPRLISLEIALPVATMLGICIIIAAGIGRKRQIKGSP